MNTKLYVFGWDGSNTTSAVGANKWRHLMDKFTTNSSGAKFQLMHVVAKFTTQVVKFTTNASGATNTRGATCIKS